MMRPTLAALFAAAAFGVAGWQQGWVTLLAGPLAAAPQVAASDREAAYRALNIGVARLEQYDFDAAATSFQEALKIAPDLALAHLDLALALFYGGKPDGGRTEAENSQRRKTLLKCFLLSSGRSRGRTVIHYNRLSKERKGNLLQYECGLSRRDYRI